MTWRQRAALAPCRSSERFQILHDIRLFPFRQVQAEVGIVMAYDLAQRGKAAVVIKASFGMRPPAPERCGAVAPVGSAVGLEIVDADLCPGMHVPARFAEGRRDRAAGAVRLAVEDALATPGRVAVEAAGRAWVRQAPVGTCAGPAVSHSPGRVVADVPKVVAGSKRKLGRVIQARVVECPFAAHRQVGDKGVPVGN